MGVSSEPSRRVDVAVIGGGPAGYSAAFRAADLGLGVALVEKGDTLGGVCLNVGCIPSKALLHLAAVGREAAALSDRGMRFAAPELDLDALRQFKDRTIGRLTTGLAGMARARGVEIVRGTASFAGPNSLDIDLGAGARRTLEFEHCVIAGGSSIAQLPFLPSDPRILDSTAALELPALPRRMLVIGGGVIGLEMATIYAGLGAAVDIVEVADGLLQDADPELVAIWRKANERHLGQIRVSTRIESVECREDGLEVRFAGQAETHRYDLILQAAGRRPDTDGLSLDRAGVAMAGGFVTTDRQMRTSTPNIFAVGDIAGPPMLAHKAVHEGHVAAEAIAGRKTAFDARVIPSVVYTDPEIAWAGFTERAAKAEGKGVSAASFPWAASGRAIASGADYGLTKLIFSTDTHRLVGGAIVGPHAGDMIGEICLAIEMGADAVDIARTIHPHPTFAETIGLAAEVAEGVCTDLPPQRAAGQRERS